MVYPALLPLMRTPRLPVVDRTDAPADLNGFVRFAERRNLVSACVPSHLKRSRLAVEGVTLLAPPTVSWRLGERHTQNLNILWTCIVLMSAFTDQHAPSLVVLRFGVH
jgi:hypothetical protein